MRKSDWFCIATLYDWLKKFAPRFRPTRSKTKTNCESLARIFTRFASVLIGSQDCMCALWLARVITLVLRLSWKPLDYKTWMDFVSNWYILYITFILSRGPVKGITICSVLGEQDRNWSWCSLFQSRLHTQRLPHRSGKLIMHNINSWYQLSSKKRNITRTLELSLQDEKSL